MIYINEPLVLHVFWLVLSLNLMVVTWERSLFEPGRDSTFVEPSYSFSYIVDFEIGIQRCQDVATPTVSNVYDINGELATAIASVEAVVRCSIVYIVWIKALVKSTNSLIFTIFLCIWKSLFLWDSSVTIKIWLLFFNWLRRKLWDLTGYGNLGATYLLHLCWWLMLICTPIHLNPLAKVYFLYFW